ncbi:MAG: T9SS type A sorting domain-containing protein [Flavobacteriia bacterium]|nr:T9SS type A sorting domain-containing protein [Flavobacteriia bacterium]
MRLHLTTVFVVLLAFLANAQKHSHSHDETLYAHPLMQKEAVQWFGGIVIQNDAVSEIKSHIFNKLPQTLGSTFELTATVESPAGTHFHFAQYIQGQPVFGTEVVAHVDASNKVRFVTANTFPTSMAQGTPVLENEEPLSAEEFLKAPITGIWFYNGQSLQPAVRQVVADGLLFEEFVTSEQGDMLWKRDLNLYTDTTVSVMVFDPDPLTSVPSIYADPYKDVNDGNTGNLDPLRVQRNVVADYNNGTFRLQNDYVKISDFDSPSTAVVTESNPQFHYSRSSDAFEQVNAFYHITQFQFYMQSLGFNLCGYQINVDANAWSGADQSSFNRSTSPPSMRFGEGGVDDAEDADVVLHEYGHAISHSASPSSNSGTERGCLDEAIGDYLAASYSRHISPFGYDRVFSWDGHNEFWNGRYASNVNNKNYQNLSFNSIYTHTDIWTSALMEIWGKLGREVTDKIVLQGVYGYASGMTMPQAAMAIVDADSTIYGGQHIQPIWEAFVNHGILDANSITVEEYDNTSEVLFYNTTGFARGQNLDVHLNKDLDYEYYLMDMSGRIISHGSISRGTERWTYSSSGLRVGTYILQLTNENGVSYRQKLVRLN